MTSVDRFALLAQKFDKFMQQSEMNVAESEAAQTEFSMEAEILQGQELAKVDSLQNMEIAGDPNELLESVAPRTIDEQNLTVTPIFVKDDSEPRPSMQEE